MRRFVTASIMAAVLALPMAGAAFASHPHHRWVQGPSCGSKFQNTEECSFRFKRGRLYVGGSVRGAGLPTGAAAIRLEAVSRVTGERRVLLSCTTPGSGACSAGGSYETGEGLRKGQRLFCIVEGAGRGTYECGTMVKKRAG